MKIFLTQFADFQCRSSALAASIVKELKREFGSALEVQFRNFPNLAKHPMALICAEAAECARRQGKFSEMHDALFAIQDSLDVEMILGIAESIGLDLDAFESDWRGHRALPAVLRDLDQAAAAGVVAAPSFTLNGMLFTKDWSLPALRAEIRFLQGQGAIAPAFELSVS